MEILPGFSGYYEAGSWVPLNISIESDLPAFEALLELSIPFGSFHLTRRSNYTITRSLMLEPGVTSRAVLALPIERREEVTLRIFSGSQPVAKKKITLTPQNGGSRNILILSRRSDLGIRAVGGRNVFQAHPGVLPTSTAGYGAVSAVVLHDAPLNEMAPGQADALVNWVRDGGVLIITGGTESRDRIPAVLADIFPFDYFGKAFVSAPLIPGGVSSFPLPPAAAYPVNPGNLKPGAEYAASPDGGYYTGAALRPEGRGTVLASVIDPEEPLYRDWPGLGDYWEYLLAAGPGCRAGYPVSDPFPDLIKQFGSRFPDSGPSLPVEVIPYAVPLLLLIIPALMRKRIRGSLFLFIIIPPAVAAAVFFFLPDDRPVYREVSVIRGAADADEGQIRLKGGVTGRRGGDLLISPGDSLVLPNRNEPLALVNGSGGSGLLLSRNSWGTREFFLSTVGPMPVETDFVRKGREISGFVRCDGTAVKPVFLNGSSSADEVIFLPESGGFSFRVILSESESPDSSPVEPSNGRGFDSAEEWFLDYLAADDLISGSSEADFYFLLIDGDGTAEFAPEGHESIALNAVILEFSL